MRILFFSPPRSCSTACCDLLAAKYNLANLQNIIDDFVQNQSMTVNQVYDYLAATDNYVAKIHSTQFAYAYRDGHLAVPWQSIDHIIFTERQNRLQQVASFLLRIAWEESVTEKPINYRQYSESNFSGEVDIARLAFVKAGYKTYDQVKQYLQDNFAEKCLTVNYETFQLATNQQVADQLSGELNMTITAQDVDAIIERKTNIDYSVNITNYDEVLDAYNGYFLKN